MTKLVDFDAFKKEQQDAEPIQLKVGGKDYELPASLPAAVALEVVTMQKTYEDDDDVPYEKLDLFGRQLFGEENWVDILGTGISLEDMGALFGLVIEAYSTPSEKDPSPKAST